jgi:NAD+ synthase
LLSLLKARSLSPRRSVQDLRRSPKLITSFISNYVSKSSTDGLVLGLSGGLDSSVVLKLAVNAIGPSRVLGLVMPSEMTPREDVDHAIQLAKSLGIKYHTIDIDTLLQAYEELLIQKDSRAKGNLMARIRMNILYYQAAINRYLVAGTSDKSELQIGYFTKWGDGAADIMPIAGLYKTQVRALAKFLDLPAAIVEKKSSPRLWEDHLAEEEIGMDYERIDQILHLLVDRKVKPNQVAKRLGFPAKDIYKIKGMIQANRHKHSVVMI